MPNIQQLCQASLKCLNLQLELDNALLVLTLNRPQSFNTVSMELLSEMRQVLDALQLQHDLFLTHDPQPSLLAPRVVILLGAGKAFSGGVDVKAADRGIAGQSWDYRDMRSQQLLALMIEKIRKVPQPFICGLQGVASGAGAALALACDVRIAVEGTRLNTSFVKLGLTGCDMGTSFFLPANLPLGVAAELMLTGRFLSSERALSLGLYNQIAPDIAAMNAQCRSMARDMLSCSMMGLILTKQQLNAVADGLSLQGALTAENSHQIYLVNQPEAANIAQAWLNTLLTQKSGKPKSKL